MNFKLISTSNLKNEKKLDINFFSPTSDELLERFMLCTNMNVLGAPSKRDARASFGKEKVLNTTYGEAAKLVSSGKPIYEGRREAITKKMDFIFMKDDESEEDDVCLEALKEEAMGVYEDGLRDLTYLGPQREERINSVIKDAAFLRILEKVSSCPNDKVLMTFPACGYVPDHFIFIKFLRNFLPKEKMICCSLVDLNKKDLSIQKTWRKSYSDELKAHNAEVFIATMDWSKPQEKKNDISVMIRPDIGDWNCNGSLVPMLKNTFENSKWGSLIICGARGECKLLRHILMASYEGFSLKFDCSTVDLPEADNRCGVISALVVTPKEKNSHP